MLVLKQHHSYTLLEILEGEKEKKKKNKEIKSPQHLFSFKVSKILLLSPRSSEYQGNLLLARQENLETHNNPSNTPTSAIATEQ